MENLTHTLIGLAAGESFARCTRPTEGGLPRAARRSLFVTLAAIGGNAPDVDLAWSYAASDRRFGYMLEHRGYTHTILGCLVLAGLLYAGAEWWMHRRRVVPAARDRWHLALVAVVGTLLHLGMDALNTYGVHPFWPFDNRWFYGDSLFIGEPLFWLAGAPLIFLVRSWLARVLLSLATMAGLLGVGWMHRGEPLSWVAIVAAALGLMAVGRWASARAAALTSVAAMAGVIAISVACGSVAATRIDGILAARFPGDRSIDRILMPTPAYPLCWEVLALQTRGDLYMVRDGVLSITPEVVPIGRCPVVFPRRPPARRQAAPPMTPVPAPNSPSTVWFGEHSMSRAQLVRLVDGNCDAAAMMQFARAPFAFQQGDLWYLGDLRFNRDAGFQFQLGQDTPARCSIHVPWDAPRAADLLRPAAGERPLAH
ncbi:MAG TPA: metal-dependent hydrolase [Steroidobacteraceae bacterium]|nr:metal-dependent hydrolase [Steroidobacteraceae bacterium]